MYFLLAILLSSAHSEVLDDFNCTSYNPTLSSDPWRYTYGAENCKNTISDASCMALYPGDAESPLENRSMDRAKKCYSMASASPYTIDKEMQATAIATCPRRCGYCCLTEAFKCSNAQFPRLNCATITKAQCESVAWRSIIAQDCPNSCGFCNLGGCVDAVSNCGNDLSICTTVGMQDFVNQYCQRTCNRCPSSTTSSSSAVASSATCTSYIPNSSAACAAWAANGFCTNAFYTLIQRRAYCATTCRLC